MREATSLCRGRSRADLDSDRLFGLAMVRLLEVIGEAAGRVAPGDRERYPDIPWPRMVGLRNRLIHGYDVVDYNTVWDVLVDELPPLTGALERAIAQEQT